MATKSSYIQGETIDITMTAEAAAVTLVVYTSATAATAATAALESAAGNAKQSLTVGEISMTDKTAEELLALRAAVTANAEMHRYALALNDDGAWEVHASTAALCGSYSYAVLVTAATGAVESAETGAFTVIGSPSATGRGGFKTILSVF